MRIPLSEFTLPGTPGIEGDVVYTGIDYDINSGKESDGHVTYAYFVCGWREDDGAGVLIHGTKGGGATRYDWRVPRTISAPSDKDLGITTAKTEFHGVESLEGPYVRLCGCVETQEEPGKKKGFFYEGYVDGSGEWYSIDINDKPNTIVKGSKAEVLVCSCGEEGTDSVFVYDLTTHSWVELHSGYSLSWEVDEVIQAGELYIIRLVHSDGHRSDIPYQKK